MDLVQILCLISLSMGGGNHELNDIGTCFRITVSLLGCDHVPPAPLKIAAGANFAFFSKLPITSQK